MTSTKHFFQKIFFLLIFICSTNFLNSQIMTLTGHTGYVRSVSFSPDGTKLASGSDDNTIKLWNVTTGALLNTLTGHTYSVNSVTFSPDGTNLASGSCDNSIKIWNVSTGSLLNTLGQNQSCFFSVSFSPDGTKIASGAYQGWVALWNVSNGNQIRMFTNVYNGTLNVTSVAFSPDGTKLASGSWDGSYGAKIKLWNINDGTLIWSQYIRFPHSIAFSPDGTKLASGNDDGTIQLLNVSDGTLIRTITIPGPIIDNVSVQSVAFSPDGNKLVSGGGSDFVGLWNVNNGNLINQLVNQPLETVYSVVFSPDGTKIATGGGSSTIKIWDIHEYTISGNITGASSVTVTLIGSSSGTTTTDVYGNYSFTVNSGGTYTITPSKQNYSFIPSSQTFYNITSNQVQNFTAATNAVTINGIISGASLVTVTLSGSSSGITTTDTSGNYSFTVNAGGTYTVTPSKANYSFIPPGATFSNISSNQTQNFTALSNTVIISGNITGASSVTVTLSGSSSGTKTTDANGNYSFTVNASGTYTVTPSKSNYAFIPQTQTFYNITSNQVQNFTASINTVTISGNITGASSVTVTLSGSSSKTITSDVNGNYSFTVNVGGSYTITPSKTNYSFTPMTATFSNMLSNQTQNFSASLNKVTINGKILNTDLDLDYGTQISNSFTSVNPAQVKLYQGSTLISTINNDGSDNFSFDGLPPNQNYKLVVSAMDNVPGSSQVIKLSYEKDVTSGDQNIVFNIPLAMFQKKYDLINTLENNLSITREFFGGFWNQDVKIINQYNESEIRNTFQDWSNSNYDKLEKINRALERTLIAENLVYKMFGQSSKVGAAAISTGHDIFSLFFGVNAVIENVKNLKLLQSPLFYPFLQGINSLISRILEVIGSFISNIFHLADSFLSPEGTNTLGKYGDAIELLLGKAGTLIKEGQLSFDYKEVLKQMLIPVAEEILISGYYIPKTQETVNSLANNASTLRYTGNLNDAFKNTISENQSDYSTSIFMKFKDKVQNDLTKVTSYTNIANFGASASDIITIAVTVGTGVNVLAGMLAKLITSAPSAYLYSKSFRIEINDLYESYSQLTTGVAKSWNSDFSYLLADKENVSLGSGYMPVGLIDSKIISNNIMQVKKANESYDSILTIIKEKVSQNKKEEVVQLIPKLLSADSMLTQKMFFAQTPIFATASNATNTIPNFDSIFYNTSSSVQLSELQRLQVCAALLQYISDTTNSKGNKDTLTNFAEQAKQSNTNAQNTLNSTVNLITGVTAPGLIMVTNVSLPSFIRPNMTFTLTATLKNVGGAKADSVYVAFKPGLYTSSDTSRIFVGSLNVNEEKNFSWNLTVNSDTVGFDSYSIIVSSTNAKTISMRNVFNIAVNHAPLAFSLGKPLKGDTLLITLPATPLRFVWNASRDVDNDKMSYTFVLKNSDYEYKFSNIQDTFFVFNNMQDLKLNNKYYWFVNSTDGKFVVYSDTSNFVTSSKLTNVESSLTNSKYYQLYQNYPNPFNPSTCIKFQLPTNSLVTLKVYDVLGKEVVTLVNQYLSSGEHSVIFDTKFVSGGLPSGIYYYKFMVGYYSEMKKMLYLR